MGGEKDSRFRGLFRHRLEAHAYKSAAAGNAAMAKAARASLVHQSATMNDQLLSMVGNYQVAVWEHMPDDGGSYSNVDGWWTAALMPNSPPR
jgi:hypothetical protein